MKNPGVNDILDFQLLKKNSGDKTVLYLKKKLSVSATLNFRFPTIQHGLFNRARSFLQINRNDERLKSRQLPFRWEKKKLVNF